MVEIQIVRGNITARIAVRTIRAANAQVELVRLVAFGEETYEHLESQE